MAFSGRLLLAVLLLVPVAAVRLLSDVPSPGASGGASYDKVIGIFAVEMHNREDGASQLRFCEVTKASSRSNGPSSQAYTLSIVVRATSGGLELYRAKVIVSTNYSEPMVFRSFDHIKNVDHAPGVSCP